MEKFEKRRKEAIEITRFLQSGTQTRITPDIQKIAAGFTEQALQKTKQITDFLRSFENRRFDNKLFRKRTAEKIIQDKYVTGCTDSALAFTVLARASGLPTKYIETIDKSWLEKGGGSIDGHVYTQVHDDFSERWVWVDPMSGKVDVPKPTERVIFKEGLDSWDIGINDFNSLKNQFELFRNTFAKINK